MIYVPYFSSPIRFSRQSHVCRVLHRASRTSEPMLTRNSEKIHGFWNQLVQKNPDDSVTPGTRIPKRLKEVGAKVPQSAFALPTMKRLERGRSLYSCPESRISIAP